MHPSDAASEARRASRVRGEKTDFDMRCPNCKVCFVMVYSPQPKPSEDSDDDVVEVPPPPKQEAPMSEWLEDDDGKEAEMPPSYGKDESEDEVRTCDAETSEDDEEEEEVKLHAIAAPDDDDKDDKDYVEGESEEEEQDGGSEEEQDDDDGSEEEQDDDDGSEEEQDDEGRKKKTKRSEKKTKRSEKKMKRSEESKKKRRYPLRNREPEIHPGPGTPMQAPPYITDKGERVAFALTHSSTPYEGGVRCFSKGCKYDGISAWHPRAEFTPAMLKKSRPTCTRPTTMSDYNRRMLHGAAGFRHWCIRCRRSLPDTAFAAEDIGNRTVVCLECSGRIVDEEEL